MINLKDKKISSIYLGNKKINSVYLGNKQVYSSSLLPSKYQQVEYIESTSDGGQCIDTGVIPDENTSVRLTAMALSNPNSYYFGCVEVDMRKTWRFFNVSNGMIYFDVNTTRMSNFINPISLNVKIEWYLGNAFIVRNGREVVTGTRQTNLGLSSTMYMFGCTYQGTLRPSHQRIYNCIIYDNENIIRNFIPCYRKADGEIGLYDLVNKEFYTNAGTGTFLKGGDV